jgi:hypothetical protein
MSWLSRGVCKRGLRQVLPAALLLLCAVLPAPAPAFDLFARYVVDVQFASRDGKPMANAEVTVFAPGESGRPYTTGRTDADGKFRFDADRDGFWTAEARSGGEVARATLRVGAANPRKPVPALYVVVGALGLLLVLAVWVRFLRARNRRRRR